MHATEIEIKESLVKQLLEEQFPQWAQLPLQCIQSIGTDNAIFRLGTDMCVRLPRRPEADEHIEAEQKWLPILAPQLPLTIPVPLAHGKPHEFYPWHWSIYRWLEGENASIAHIPDEQQAAKDLAQFIMALQKIDATSGPLSHRGVSLANRDQETRTAIQSLGDVIDTHAALKLWEKCLQAPTWNKPPVWLHGDLLSANILVQHERISAIIDFDSLGIGDPACDLIPAWCLFSHDARAIFRKSLAADAALWMRGKGWALSIAVIIIPYYKNSNPGLVAIAQRMLHELSLD